MSLPLDNTNKKAIDYVYSVSDRIILLCDPLKYLGITHFGYLKFFENGSYFKLSNDPKWAENYFKRDLADKTEAFVESLKSVPVFTLDSQLWPDSKGGDCLSSLYDANIWNGINFNTKDETSIEVFYFATSRENQQVYNIYINHIELLKRFILYFKEKAHDILDTSDTHKLAKQKSSISFVQAVAQASNTKISNTEIKEFMEDTEIHRYYLSGKYSHIYLTKRESECMKYLAKGKTSKEIGKLVNLSPRTVESYINNLRIKTGANSASQLVDIYLESFIRDIV